MPGWLFRTGSPVKGLAKMIFNNKSFRTMCVLNKHMNEMLVDLTNIRKYAEAWEQARTAKNDGQMKILEERIQPHAANFVKKMQQIKGNLKFNDINALYRRLVEVDKKTKKK